MIKKLIHKLKLRFGKKTDLKESVIRGVQHSNHEDLDSWGTVSLPSHRRPPKEGIVNLEDTEFSNMAPAEVLSKVLEYLQKDYGWSDDDLLDYLNKVHLSC